MANFNHNQGKILLNTLQPRSYDVFHTGWWEWEFFLVLCELQELLPLITVGDSISGLKAFPHKCLLISIHLITEGELSADLQNSLSVQQYPFW